MKQRKPFAEQIAAAADLETEPIPTLPLVEIAGNCRVLVEHHKGVTEYGQNVIGIKVKFGTVCISGRNLSLSHMTKERLVVTGCIESVQLIRG